LGSKKPVSESFQIFANPLFPKFSGISPDWQEVTELGQCQGIVALLSIQPEISSLGGLEMNSIF